MHRARIPTLLCAHLSTPQARNCPRRPNSTLSLPDTIQEQQNDQVLNSPWAEKILDCHQVSNAILNLSKETKERFGLDPRVSILLPVDEKGQGRVDSRNYVAKKRKLFDSLNIKSEIIKIFPSTPEEEVRDTIVTLGQDSSVSGVMIQLPFMPNSGVNTDMIHHISKHQDIDGLTKDSKTDLFSCCTAPTGIKPATPLGICALLQYYNIPTQGKHVVILGKGALVGQPLSVMLSGSPYFATVTNCDIHTQNAKEISRTADILVVAIGSAHRINHEYVKEGGIVIDVGINRAPPELRQKTKITGDVCPSAYEKCGHFTPVPGGVGLLTVASLAFNTINAALASNGYPMMSLTQMIKGQGVDRGEDENGRIDGYLPPSGTGGGKSKGLSVLLLSSAYNGMTQRIENELLLRGHKVAFQLADSGESMRWATEEYKPDIVICPTLMKAIPKDVYTKVKCLIVHPGIKGDRGPSSLDWTILENKDEWGVTVLEASEEMDAGDIWATSNFQVPKGISKTALYNSCVVDTATKCVLECLEKSQSTSFKPEPLDPQSPTVKGKLHETIKQTHPSRNIDFQKDTSSVIVDKIRAADSQPGLKATIDLDGTSLTRFLYGGAPEGSLNSDLSFPPGSVIARKHDSICIATRDGAFWASQLRSPKVKGVSTTGSSLKLPATLNLGPELSQRIPLQIDSVLLPRPQQNTFQDISFEQVGPLGILHFHFYNGAMSTSQCERLTSAIQQIGSIGGIQALVLAGSPGSWSNGIHLATIEAAEDPAIEADHNIRAINKVVKSILDLNQIMTISALQANAGAGGVYLALASDFIFARPGVVLNPHYKNMGLYGSELHSYTTPKRIGHHGLAQLKESARPLLAKEASRIGLIDHLGHELGKLPAEVKSQSSNIKPSSFLQTVIDFAHGFMSAPGGRANELIQRKLETHDKDTKLRRVCEEHELEEMRKDMFENRNGFAERRRAFLSKTVYVPSEVKKVEEVRSS